MTLNHAVGLAVGGALYGYLSKQAFFQKLPAMPIAGKTGTAAIVLTYLSSRTNLGGGLVKQAAVAASVLAGYQLGHDGHISGDELSGDDSAVGFDPA